MKSTQGKVLAAYTTIVRIGRKPMESKAAYKLFKLKKAMQDSVDFQAEQEEKFVTELGGEISAEGRIVFKDADKGAEYNGKRKALAEMECEIGIDKPLFNVRELPEISIAELETLDDFIEVKE